MKKNEKKHRNGPKKAWKFYTKQGINAVSKKELEKAQKSSIDKERIEELRNFKGLKFRDSVKSYSDGSSMSSMHPDSSWKIVID